MTYTTENVYSGCEGRDRNGKIAKIIAIVPKDQWETLKQYDSTGWLNSPALQEYLSDTWHDNTHLVAIEYGNRGMYGILIDDKSTKTAVMPYGTSGYVAQDPLLVTEDGVNIWYQNDGVHILDISTGQTWFKALYWISPDANNTSIKYFASHLAMTGYMTDNDISLAQS